MCVCILCVCVCARVCCVTCMHMRDGGVSILQYTLLSTWGKQYLVPSHIFIMEHSPLFTPDIYYMYILVCVHVESVDLWKQSVTASYIYI